MHAQKQTRNTHTHYVYILHTHIKAPTSHIQCKWASPKRTVDRYQCSQTLCAENLRPTTTTTKTRTIRTTRTTKTRTTKTKTTKTKTTKTRTRTRTTTTTTNPLLPPVCLPCSSCSSALILQDAQSHAAMFQPAFSKRPPAFSCYTKSKISDKSTLI